MGKEASSNDEITSFRQLPGIVGHNPFCVHPDGNTAFIYHYAQRCFIQISINDGQMIPIKPEDTKEIVGEQGWRNIRPTTRNSNTFIIASIMEKNTKKWFIVSLLLSGEKLLIVHEHFCGIRSRYFGSYLISDEKDQIYFVSCDDWTGSKTELDLVKIDVDNDGTITSQFRLKSLTINGYWVRPFVRADSDEIYFIDGSIGKHERLMSISISSESVDEIYCANNNENWPGDREGMRWTVPTIVKDQIFFYLYDENEKMGFIYYCDWNLRCWKQFSFDMNEHVIEWPWIDHSNDGRLYLHGQCSLASCKEKAHIYIINVDKDKSVARLLPSLSDALASVQDIDLRTLIRLEQTVIDSIFIQLPEKIKKIGQGACSTVYEFKMPNGTLVAGKKARIALFQMKKEDEEKLKKQLNLALNEIMVLHQLDHENIVKYIGCFWDASRLIIFMELMPLSVYALIRKYSLSEAQCVNYTMQTAKGLSYLHNLRPKAVVHRDIKCENLLLNEQGIVKLTDFGYAIHLTINSASLSRSSVAPKSMAGTYRFMAPEVLSDMENPEAYGRKSDIWSLGCTICEMLNRFPPFYDIGQTTLVRLASSSEHWLQYSGERLLPGASEGIQKLLNCLFIVDQQKRPAIDTVLKVVQGMEQNDMSALNELSNALLAT